MKVKSNKKSKQIQKTQTGDTRKKWEFSLSSLTIAVSLASNDDKEKECEPQLKKLA